MRIGYRIAVLLTATLGLAACQSPATYHPLDRASGTGYTDEQLAANRYRITFTGNSVTKRQTVENYLLLRAAEVTLKSGYPAFAFDARDTQADTTYHSDFVGWPGWRGRGRYWHSWGYGPGFGPDMTVRATTSYEAFAEIVLLTDVQAAQDPRSLRAEDVLAHVGPTAQSPAQP
jgi:hypothetical protein